MSSRPKTSREFCRLFDTVAVSARQVGSHRTYKMPDGSLVTIPCHNGELSPGLKCKLVKLAVRYGVLIAVLIIAVGLYLA